MLEPSDIQPGRKTSTFTAEEYNALVEQIKQNLARSYAPPLARNGTVVGLDRGRSFWALLSGSSSPYSWTAKLGDTGGTYADGPDSGTSNAYEVNGVSGLSGKYVRLYPGAADDYRFQWIANGGTYPPDCLCWNTGSLPTTLNWSVEWHCEKYGGGMSGNVTLGTTSGTLTLDSTAPLEVPVAGTWGSTCRVPASPTDSGSDLIGWYGAFCYTLNNPAGSLQDCVSRTETYCDGDDIDFGYGPYTRRLYLVFVCSPVLGNLTDGFRNHGMVDTQEDPGGCLYGTDGNYYTPSPDDLPCGDNTCGPPTISYSCSPFVYTATYPNGTVLTITE